MAMRIILNGNANKHQSQRESKEYKNTFCFAVKLRTGFYHSEEGLLPQLRYTVGISVK
jgi:hypothetical protein